MKNYQVDAVMNGGDCHPALREWIVKNGGTVEEIRVGRFRVKFKAPLVEEASAFFFATAPRCNCRSNGCGYKPVFSDYEVKEITCWTVKTK